MTSYAAVGLIALRTANTTKQGTAHTAEAPATRRVVEGAVVLVVGRSVPARYTSPVRERMVIAYGFCVVFRPS